MTTNRILYPVPNAVGLAASRGLPTPYIETIMGRVIVTAPSKGK